MKHRLSPSGPFLSGHFAIVALGGGVNELAVDLDDAGVQIASFAPAAGEAKTGDLVLAWFNARAINTANAGVRRVTLELQIDATDINQPVELPLATLADAPLNERLLVSQAFAVLASDDPTIALVGAQDAGTDVQIPADSAFFETVILRPIS